MTQVSITLHRKKFVRYVAGLVFLLTALHLAGLYLKFGLGYSTAMGFIPAFNFEVEANFPTYISALLLAFSSLLLYWISRQEKKRQSSFARQWLLLSMIFLALSFDEIVGFHELMNYPIQSALDIESGYFYFPWIIAGMVVVGLLAVFFARFFFSLAPATRVGLSLAAVFYLGGTIGLEALGGKHAAVYGLENAAYQYYVLFEEVFEMLGITLLINTLLRHLQTANSSIEIHIAD